MSETQEGRSRSSFSGEESQPSTMQGESSYQAASETPVASPFDNRPEPAGEISDVVADDKQETNEDSTADEEEPTTWQSSHSPEEQTNQSIPPDIEKQPITHTKHVTHDNAEISSDVFESAGETADVVQDATQAGSDRRAAHAEEKSLDQAANQTHANQAEET
ncbi:hypothetical protein ACFLYO_00595 [Chloroflexota bacterium]